MNDIHVLFDRPHPLYLAGESITGTIQWPQPTILREDERTTIPTSSFIVTFSGLAECRWHDDEISTTSTTKEKGTPYHSTFLLCFDQRPTNTFVTPPQPIVRGVTVVTLDDRFNIACADITLDNENEPSFSILQVLWWPRRQHLTSSNGPVYLGETIVRAKDEQVESSHLLTPCMHSSDNQPHVHSIQLSQNTAVTTVHSVTLHEPFIEGGSLQVILYFASNNNQRSARPSTTFSFSIPRAVPSSFVAVNPHARIRYFITVLFRNDDNMYQVHEQDLSVLSQSPPPLTSSLWRPTWTSYQEFPIPITRSFPWFANSSNDDLVACQLGLSKRIYAPGEVLQFTSQTHVQNQTHDHDIQMTLRLIRTLTCTVLDGYVRRQVTCKSYPIGTLRKRRFSKILYPQESWEPTTTLDADDSDVFVIPSVPPSTSHSHTVQELPVNISYAVQLHVSPANNNETFAHIILPVYICALPPTAVPDLQDDKGVEWGEALKECWPETDNDSIPLPELCVLPTESKLLWDVAINGRPGVYSPQQHVLTLMNNDEDTEEEGEDDEHSVETSPSLEENAIVQTRRTMVPDDESISDPDDEDDTQCSISDPDE